MAWDEAAKVFPVAGSLEAAAEEPAHGPDAAGKEADEEPVEKVGGLQGARGGAD